MKKSFTLFILLFSIIIWGQKASDNSYSFYENKGQIVDQNGKINPNVKYLFNSNGLNVQLRNNGFSYDVYELEKIDNETIKQSNNFRNTGFGKEEKKISYTRKNHRVDIDLIQSNPNIEVVAEGASADYENFYNIPNKPEGVTNVKRYKKVTYKNVYPNIDLVFFKPSDTSKVIEYNFIVNPGGKVSDIKMKFSGAKTNLNAGKISMNLRFGEMQENIPLSWTENSSAKKNISVQYKDLGNNTYGFNSPLNSSLSDKIVIDPVPTRIWGSYYGGQRDETILDMKSKNLSVFALGRTFSDSYIATSGTYQTSFNTTTANFYLFKIDGNSNKIWGTYISSNYSNPLDLETFAVDDNENTFVAGSFKSDAYIIKLNKDGQYISNKVYGGTGTDTFTTIEVVNGNIYAAGSTSSQNNIATPGSFQSFNNHISTIGFLVKFDTSYNQEWGTYLGYSNGGANIYKINVSNDETVTVLGQVTGTDVKLIAPIQATNNIGYSGYFALFDKNCIVKQSSYLGDTSTTYLYNSKIIGNTLVILGYFDLGFNDFYDGIYNIDLATNRIVTKSYFKYRLHHGPNDISSFIDNDKNIYFTSKSSYGADVATPNAFENDQFSNNPFLVKFNLYGTKLWGTHLGKTAILELPKLTIDDQKNIYVGASAILGNISTNGTTPIGGRDLFIYKFRECPIIVKSSKSTYCPGSTIQLHAEGGTTYAWTGPNGFTSSLQDPTISDATAAMSGTYQCKVTGSGDCDGTFTVEVKVEDIKKPVPDKATLPVIKGKCSVIVTDTPTATDECAGSIIGTTTDDLTYSNPGTYTINWVYQDPSGNKEYQNQTIIVEEEDLPTHASIPVFCINEGKKISDLRSYITGSNLKFYDSSNVLITNESALLQSGKYYVTQTLTCESAKAEINITVNQTSKPLLLAPAEFCSTQNAKLSDIKIDGQNLTWYDATGVILPNNTLVQDGVTYYVTQTLNSCESDKLDVPVTFTMNAILANSYSTKICNDKYGNTKDNFELKQFEGNIDPGSHGYNFEYFDKNNLPISNIQTLHLGLNEYKVKVSLGTGCFKIVDLDITLNEKPNAKLPAKDEFCKGSSKILEVENRPDWTYLWSTGETTSSISITTAGTYSVKITNTNGCTDEQSVVVSYTKMTNIQKVEVNNSTATIILEDKSNDYLFSLDEITWQSSPTFSSINNGSYIASVKTKTGCVVGQIPFTIFKIANAFSPNGDGINDTWTIGGLENYPGSRVQLFDRYGKKVFEQIVNGIFSWNGHSEGRPLPTATYYYVINISDGRVLNGSLLLKNRN